METQRPSFDPVALIAEPPEDEFSLLELRLDWPYDLEIHPELRQLWLRHFVITEDPLSWIPDRGEMWTAVTVDDEVIEIDLYVTLALVRRGIEQHDGDLARAIGRYATAVLQAGLEHEQLLVSGDYPDRAIRGEVPRLLDDLDRNPGEFGTPELQCRRGWSPLGLGALTDLVQHSFGTIDLDRSPVKLDPVAPETEDCRACTGETFGFPGGLEDARESLCTPHQAAARTLNTLRLGRARQSNFAGWRAVDKAARRVNKLPEPRYAPQPPRIIAATPSRNDPCPCGSGRKYKRCHGA